MDLLIGILILFLGLFVAIMAYNNIRIKKKMSFIWGGYTLISFSIILITFGVFVVRNGI